MQRLAAIALPLVTAVAISTMPADASDAVDGWNWKSRQTEINAEGILWNDFLGDGQDRWKSGGLTQSFTFPERIFDTDPWTPWFDGRTSGIEFQGRAVVVTPDNTASAAADDRPYAQYLGLGVYLRSDREPRALSEAVSLGVEDRIGAEIGWTGEPLFLFDVQDAIHGAAGMDETNVTQDNSVGGGALANLEARRTWRLHRDLGDSDLELAPYSDLSLGMRQNDLRVGGDVIWGRSLAGRSWNMDSATGTMMPGRRPPHDGIDWAFYAGGDVGYVVSDALLGGVTGGRSVNPEPVQVRLRAGAVAGVRRMDVHYGVSWLSPEFEGQGEGQWIGAVSLKLPF